MKNCVIIIPPYTPGGEGVDVTTGDVSHVDILNALQTLSKHFAQQLVRTAQEETGSTDEAVWGPHLQRILDVNQNLRNLF